MDAAVEELMLERDRLLEAEMRAADELEERLATHVEPDSNAALGLRAGVH